MRGFAAPSNGPNVALALRSRRSTNPRTHAYPNGGAATLPPHAPSHLGLSAATSLYDSPMYGAADDPYTVPDPYTTLFPPGSSPIAEESHRVVQQAASSVLFDPIDFSAAASVLGAAGITNGVAAAAADGGRTPPTAQASAASVVDADKGAAAQYGGGAGMAKGSAWAGAADSPRSPAPTGGGGGWTGSGGGGGGYGSPSLAGVGAGGNGVAHTPASASTTCVLDALVMQAELLCGLVASLCALQGHVRWGERRAAKEGGVFRLE